MSQPFDQLLLAKKCGGVYSGHVFTFIFLSFFCSISHVEMSVILHFIYGGVLDFPDKVDVGYMSTFIIFNCSLCLFCIFSVKCQNESSSCSINKTKMSNLMIITPKLT